MPMGRIFANFDPGCHRRTNSFSGGGHISWIPDTLVNHRERGISHLLGPSLPGWLGWRSTLRTDHQNLLFTNNHCSRKVVVFQWKLDIQHYDTTIEHVPGKANIPADMFSRLVVRPTPIEVHHILVLQCTPTRTLSLVPICPPGVEKTLALMIEHAPKETNEKN